MINYNFITDKAKKEKIDRITILREYWQLLFLQGLYSQKRSSDVYFKGGTAIRFLFDSFRFSEDLDFTVNLKEKEATSVIKSTFSVLQKETSEEIVLKKQRIIVDSWRYKLAFSHQFSKQPLSIRIDFVGRERPQTREERVLIPFDYPISPYPLVIHLSAEEILAEKLRALLVRGKARDIFDVWFLLTKDTTIDNKIISKKMKLYPRVKFKIAKIIRRIHSFDKKKLKQDLNQFLPENYRQLYQKLPGLTVELLEKASKGSKDLVLFNLQKKQSRKITP